MLEHFLSLSLLQPPATFLLGLLFFPLPTQRLSLFDCPLGLCPRSFFLFLAHFLNSVQFGLLGLPLHARLCFVLFLQLPLSLLLSLQDLSRAVIASQRLLSWRIGDGG